MEVTATKSRFVQSGVVVREPQFDRLVAQAGGSKTGGHITMPFWNDLSAGTDAAGTQITDSSGDSQANASGLISAVGTAMDSIKLDGTGKDIATKHGRRKAWATGSLVQHLIDTEDPLTLIANRVGTYWAREDQKLLISTLKGVFAAASMAVNLSAIHSESIAGQSEATKLTGITVLDGLQKLGDAKDLLTAICMHSAVETSLAKRDLIDYIPDSEAKGEIPTFMGRRVIVDDGCPLRDGTTDGKVYRTYLFGAGAVAHGETDLSMEPLEGAGFGTYGVEMARDANAENTFVYFRRIFIMHPRGVKWVGTPSLEFATNAELETGTNWTRVYEAKNVRMVAIDHNI